MHPKDEEGIANSVDPDQTAPLRAVWSGSALFAQTWLSENLDHYGKKHKEWETDHRCLDKMQIQSSAKTYETYPYIKSSYAVATMYLSAPALQT